MKANDYTKFKLSKPWGYYPPDVEKVLEQYETTIGMLNDKLSEKIQLCSKYQERIKKLEEELRAMHIEMSSLELPDTEEMVESVVLGDFRNYPNDLDEPMEALRNSSPQANDVGIVTNITDGVKICDQEDLNGSSMIGIYDEESDGVQSNKFFTTNPKVESEVKLNQSNNSNSSKLNLGKKQDDNDEGGFFKIVT